VLRTVHSQNGYTAANFVELLKRVAWKNHLTEEKVTSLQKMATGCNVLDKALRTPGKTENV